MSEPKTSCIKCSAQILEATALRTGGLCMPCETRRLRDAEPQLPVTISCEIGSCARVGAVFSASAQDVLRRFGESQLGDPTDADSMHPHRLELEAQTALLGYAIQSRRELWLHDDHWGHTSGLLLNMFEQNEATMRVGNRSFMRSAVFREEWADCYGSGWLYRDPDGNILYKHLLLWIN